MSLKTNLHMPGPEYYRRQSEICLQLALLRSDERETFRLVELAKEFQARAEQAEREPENPPMPAYLMDAAAPQGSGID